MNEDMYQQDEEEEEGEPRKSLNLTTEHFYKLYNNWPSSRIIRVSRASGGKDRHSKVLTSKGLRDRRVRLSVTTAIQFYDLQDRLGYDQPSKAFEWLLKAATSSIDELPPINSPFFPDTPKQNQITSDERSSSRSDKADVDVDANNSAENSVKGSGLSLSRSESRVRARERAKERVLRTETKVEKKDGNGNNEYLQMNPNHVSRTTSFTELLSGGMNGDVVVDNHSQNRQWNHYFTHECNNMKFTSSSGFGGHETSSMEIQHLPSTFAPDLLAPVTGNCNENNLINFAISSSSSSGANSSSLGLTGFNRGTLQSNSFSMSESFLSQPQRFNPQDGFFFTSSMPVENNHQFHLSGFDDDARLQLCYGNNAHAGNDNHKVKGKN